MKFWINESILRCVFCTVAQVHTYINTYLQLQAYRKKFYRCTITTKDHEIVICEVFHILIFHDRKIGTRVHSFLLIHSYKLISITPRNSNRETVKWKLSIHYRKEPTPKRIISVRKIINDYYHKKIVSRARRISWPSVRVRTSNRGIRDPGRGIGATPGAEIKLDIGVGALLLPRIRRTRYRGLLVRMGRVRIAPWSLERTRRGWERSRGGRTRRREGALLRKMTCHSRHVPSSPPSCSATERSVLLYHLSLLFSFHPPLPPLPPHLPPYSNPSVI